MKHTLKVKAESFRQLQALTKKNDTEMAKAIGVSRQTYARALDGEPVSSGFVAGTMIAFNVGWEPLFYAEREEIIAA